MFGKLVDITNGFLPLIFFFSSVIIFTPIEKYFKGLSKLYLLIIMGFIMLIIYYLMFGGLYLVQIGLIFLCLWVFVFGFLSNRKYIYSFAFMFLIFTPVLYLITLTDLAQLTAAFVCLLIIIGIIKDVFYEKIFTK
jgi:hypothetical protein